MSCSLEALDELPERREERQPVQEAVGTALAVNQNEVQTLQQAQQAADTGDTSALMRILERVMSKLDNLAGKHIYGG